jgi:hypothetical protein
MWVAALTVGALIVAVQAVPSTAEGTSVTPGPAPSAAGPAPSAARPTTTPKFTATGYFRTTEYDGHWYFVTPQGAPFFASGIDTVTADGDTDQVTGQCPYCEAVAAQYPSIAAWGTATLARLRQWGFNTLGSFSDDTTLGGQMPFEVQLSMASGNDWFAPSFVTNADEVAATQVAPLADNPNLIGYFTDTELNWGPPDTPNHKTLLDYYLTLPAGSPGLAVAKRYIGNPAGFVYAVATRYFQVTTAAIRMYDPHHLILGAKAEGQEIQPQLLEAARHYINVFSVEDYLYRDKIDSAVDRIWPYYLPVESNLADLEQYFGGPLLIGEYSFIAAGPQDPNTVPGIYYVAPNQQTRADTYESNFAPLYENAPWLVGDDWFEFVDEPRGGRTGDGENNEFGVVNVDNQPYTDMTSAMATMHSITGAQLIQSGSTCDGWATGPHGVTCTVKVPHRSYPPLFATTSLPAGQIDKAYLSGAYAVGGVPPYTYRVISGSLPAGVTLTATAGTISGTPTHDGTFTFTVRATSAADPTGLTRQLTLVIAPPPLAVAATSLPTAVVGVAYAKALKATGGYTPYSWSISAGHLPAGMTLTSAGELSGKPTTAGTFAITVRVEDASHPALTATAKLSLVVDSR